MSRSPAADVVADTTPYPWPYDGVLAPDRLALVVAGHDGGWGGRVSDAGRVAPVVDRLVAALLGIGALVVRIEHGPDIVGAPPGALATDPEVTVVRAAGTDGFYGSGLDALLRRTRRDHLLLAGFGLEAPVHSTLRSANDRGYECLLLLDACAALDPALTPSARSMIEMSGGIFGAVGSVAALAVALDLPIPSRSLEISS